MSLIAEERKALIELANEVRKYAYVPYSKYPVGAALRTRSGRVFTGVNVENAVFPVTNCAERTAVFKAVSEGEREFDAIAVVTDNGGSPCGACRQVLAEFGLGTLVIIADGTGRVVREMTVAELLPEAFTPQHLENR
ncbi:MAG: cytidine deaminase [Bacteroidota bacterium]